MRFLIASILCLTIAGFILVCVLTGCAEQKIKPLPEGAKTAPPIGYYIHCQQFPDSIFCPGNKK